MRSLLCRQADTYEIYYGNGPLISFEKSQNNNNENVFVTQIDPMRIEDVEEDYFGLDETDRAEIRRMETDESRALAPYIRREVDRMESEGDIPGDESLDYAHILRAVENIMAKLGQQSQPDSYLEDLVTILLLNELFDRRRRNRRR